MSMSSPKSEPSGVARSPGAAIAPKIGLVVLVAALVVVVPWMVLQQSSRHNSIPKEVAGYKLVRSVQGAEAVQMAVGMHQGSPKIIDAWIAYYEQDGVVWVGTTESPQVAQEQLEAMDQAIAKGGIGYSIPSELQISGRRVLAVADRSGTNYFFQSDSRVIWAKPPEGSGTSFVEALLRTF